MKHNISIVLLEEHAHVNFYSIVIDHNVNSEFEDFLTKIEEANERDASNIVKAITKVGSVGAEERFFRYEGLKSDNVLALPPHYIIETDLRLYLLRYSESVVIFGNGGIKDVRVYQDDTYLNKCVTVLQRVDEQIKILIQSGDITIDGKTITGETDFTIYT